MIAIIKCLPPCGRSLYSLLMDRCVGVYIMGKCVNIDELKEWVDNWVNVYKYYHPYAKNFDIPIDELNDILERIPPASVECESLSESGV